MEFLNLKGPRALFLSCVLLAWQRLKKNLMCLIFSQVSIIYEQRSHWSHCATYPYTKIAFPYDGLHTTEHRPGGKSKDIQHLCSYQLFVM